MMTDTSPTTGPRAVLLDSEDMDLSDPAEQDRLANMLYTQLFGEAPPEPTAEDIQWAEDLFAAQDAARAQAKP